MVVGGVIGHWKIGDFDFKGKENFNHSAARGLRFAPPVRLETLNKRRKR